MSKEIFVTVERPDGSSIFEYVDFSKMRSVKKSFGNAKIFMSDDIILPRKKNRIILPDFTDVYMEEDGATLCTGNYRVDAASVFPDGISALDLSGSVFNFSDLCCLKVPDSVSCIYLDSFVFSKLRNPHELLKAYEFRKSHPGVVVTDGKTDNLFDLLYSYDQEFKNEYKGSLEECLDLLKQMEEEDRKIQVLQQELDELDKLTASPEPQNKKPQTRQQETVVVAPVEQIPEKTPDYLSRRELVVLFKQRYPEYKHISDKDLNRVLRKATSRKLELNLDVKYMRLNNDVVSCVSEKCVDVLFKFVWRALIPQQNSVQKTPVAAPVVPVASADDKTQPVTEQKYYFKDKEVKKHNFKTYILRSVYSEVVSLCGKNTDDLLTLLNNIQKINVHPNSTPGNVVIAIENDKVIDVKNIEFKKQGCLAQGLGNQNNRPRIVWYYDDEKIVGVCCFSDHTGQSKNRAAYLKAIRNGDLSKVDMSNACELSVYIKGLKGNMDAGAAQRYQIGRFGDVVYELQASIDCLDLPVAQKSDIKKDLECVSSDQNMLCFVDKLENLTPNNMLIKQIADKIRNICM